MKDFLRSTTARLTASYLAIIMVMSIGFSLVLYRTGWQEIGRQLPPDSFYGDQVSAQPDAFDRFFHHRIAEGRHELFARLVLLNLLVLIAGAAISYYLARRTLKPVEEAMEVQARFSSDASHELRTPLTAIRTRNEVALRKPKLGLGEAKEVIKSNLEEILKLEQLSGGLLRLTRVDGQQLIKQPVWLEDAANEALNQFVEPAQAKKIQIEDNVPKIEVLGDPISLTQAVAALIDNAIKYGDKASTVHLTGYTKNDYGYLQVRNSGPGIRASDLPHIFDRFYRADHSRSRQGENGYGLGLSIAKQIVEQHGGEIWADSQPGEGATFTIKLPLATKERIIAPLNM